MRHWVALISVLVGGAAAATETTKEGQPAAQPTAAAQGVIEPKADAALKKMSDYLSGLNSFKVSTTTVDEKVTTDGQKIQEVQDSKVTVKRPGELRVDRVSPNGRATFRDDGKQFSIYNEDKQVYATAPAPAKLDAAIDDARDKLQVDAPGGDLFVSNPYKALTDGLVTGRYVGLEPIGGQMAHHLAISKKDTDWQIWIKDGPDALPLRYVITSKDVHAQPQFTIELKDWQPDAVVPASTFVFTAPAGAKKVEFLAPKKAEP
jgi:hypothetical protein